MLERLARLDEARERRVHAGRELLLPPEQAALAIGDEHDDDRIDARKMLCVAVRTKASPARAGGIRGVAAVRAEAVPPMPVEHRTRFAERTDERRFDKTLHCDGPQLHRFDGRRLERIRNTLGAAFERVREERAAIRFATEQHGLQRRAEFRGFVCIEQRIVTVRALEERHIVHEEQKARGRLIAQTGDEAVVVALSETRSSGASVKPMAWGGVGMVFLSMSGMRVIRADWGYSFSRTS